MIEDNGDPYNPASAAYVGASAAAAEEQELAEVERLQRLNADLINAICGDEEPQLWHITYLETLLGVLERGEEADDKATDPQAWHEHISEARTMCRRLRAALAEAGVPDQPRPVQPADVLIDESEVPL